MRRILFLAAAFAAQPALADEGNSMSGVRVEARVGFEGINAHSHLNSFHWGDSFTVGAEAGFDLPIASNLTFGPFINYDLASSGGCDASECVKSTGNFQAGGRLGLNVGQSTQLYLKGGYSQVNWKYEDLVAHTTTHSNFGSWMVGAGVDQSIHDKVYAGIEVSYAGDGNLAPLRMDRIHGAVKIGVRF